MLDSSGMTSVGKAEKRNRSTSLEYTHWKEVQMYTVTETPPGNSKYSTS